MNKLYNGFNNGRDKSDGVGGKPVSHQTKSMSLTPEQLMIPRVMCTGTEPGTPNYPKSNWDTGDILIQSLLQSWSNGNPAIYYWKSDDGELEGFLDACNPLEFPNCFRPMPWWEARKPEEMPLYLKCGSNGKVRKVARYYHSGNLLTVEFEGGRTRNLNDKWLPATESEFLNQNPTL